MFPRHNIHKHAWTSPGRKTHNQIDRIKQKDSIKTKLMSHILEELTVIPIIIWWLQMLDRDCLQVN